MTNQTLSWDRVVTRTESTSSGLYRAVWRWHFYANLLVLPFLMEFAITGALYLFKDENDALVHADLTRVEVHDASSRVAPSAMVAAALATYPGKAVKFKDPPSPKSLSELTVNAVSGEKLAVYVNTYSSQVLGSLPDRGTVMWTVRYLYSLRYFGPGARAAFEIATGSGYPSVHQLARNVPNGMGDRAASLEALPDTLPSYHLFDSDLVMAGGWACTLTARALSVSSRVQSEIILKAVL